MCSIRRAARAGIRCRSRSRRAGYNMLGVAFEQRSFLSKVLQEIFEADTFFGIIFTLDEGDDWTDETVWLKANPGLGVTPQLDEMRAYARKAQHSDESRRRVQDEAAEPVALERERLVVDGRLAGAAPTRHSRSRTSPASRATIGYDGAERDDLTAVVAVFEQDGLLYAFPKFFLPRDVVEERSRAVPAYRGWVDRRRARRRPRAR